MPGGVQTRFLQVLEVDQQMTARRIGVWIAAALLLAAPAWFLWPPLGPAVHAGAVVVGLGIGVLASRMRTRRYEASIKDEWTQWMRYSLAAETLREVHARVVGKTTAGTTARHAAALLLLWAVEVVLLAVALREEPEMLLALPAIVVPGLVVGGLLGHALHHRSWYRGLRESVTELVDSGEIGVWGVL